MLLQLDSISDYAVEFSRNWHMSGSGSILMTINYHHYFDIQMKEYVLLESN